MKTNEWCMLVESKKCGHLCEGKCWMAQEIFFGCQFESFCFEISFGKCFHEIFLNFLKFHLVNGTHHTKSEYGFFFCLG